MYLPAKTLKDAFNACDPTSPLQPDDPRYVDLTEGRGGEGDFVAQFYKRILRSKKPLVQLFAGHRGSGKSTELMRLQRNLEQAGYFTAFIELDRNEYVEDPMDFYSNILDKLETVLQEAGLGEKKPPHQKLVLLIDYPDRIQSRQTSDESVLIEHGEIFKRFGCHAVLTVPITLLLSSHPASLNTVFPERYILPNVRISGRETRQPWYVGRQLLEEIIRRRLDTETLFEEGVTERLIVMSGGNPSLLMTLTRGTLDFADEPPVTVEAVQKAVTRLAVDYLRSTPKEHWPLLARVHKQQHLHNDTQHQQMLLNLSILEYQGKEPWWDVQPTILELQPFQVALAELEQFEQRTIQSNTEADAGFLRTEPSKLTHLEVQDLRVFDSLTVDLEAGEPDRGQWILLLGDNGVGKTTLLRMIALACVEQQTAGALLEWSGDSAPFIRHGSDETRVSLHLSTGVAEFSIRQSATSQRLTRHLSPDVPPGPVFAYGCQRGTALGGPDREVEFRMIDNVRTLFDTNGHLIHAETWLKGLQLAAYGEGRDKEFFEAVRATLIAALPGVDSIDASSNGQVWLSGPKIERSPLAAMGDGYITTIGWIIDLIARWAEWNRRLGAPLSGDFREKMTGLVLIDEIDLHLHPQWQVEIVSALREQFPRLSFVVTTHNPLTLLGCQAGEVHVLRRQPETNRVVLEQIDVPPGSRADQVLTGTWFGLASTIDIETRGMLAEHRQMLREGVSRSDPRRKKLEGQIRERTGTFAETSVERLVHGVAAELIVDDLEGKLPEERQALRDEIRDEARRRKQDASL